MGTSAVKCLAMLLFSGVAQKLIFRIEPMVDKVTENLKVTGNNEDAFAHWATFLTAAVLLNISPGPDMAFILGQTAKRGVQSGFSAMFGIWTGAFIHVIFAALGLSAILATSAVAFSN
ncbi:hypothetical protein DGMP_26630 [Desulfomarina profundi]|uniref:LysE family translocator n=1 Tax=Desulfomarina profundi TaxID=2772557 RepID=A0A8D5JQ39_9BACT|nr:LysE family transporter [Desulfomarina profundi]BCL61970.1 hypothetical protein DGMP_26630 [Desulfomarina profundi]